MTSWTLGWLVVHLAYWLHSWRDSAKERIHTNNVPQLNDQNVARMLKCEVYN